MKARSFILSTIISAIICLAIWWFVRPKAVVAPKKAEAENRSGITHASQPNAANAVVLPAVPATGSLSVASSKTGAAPATGGEANTTLPPDGTADPQANLATAFVDMKRLIRAGEMVQFYQTYKLPGTFSDEDRQKLQAIQDRLAINPNPVDEERREEFAQIIEELEGQVPTYNAAGDEATYIYTPLAPPGGDKVVATISVTFAKIHGKWYLKN